MDDKTLVQGGRQDAAAGKELSWEEYAGELKKVLEEVDPFTDMVLCDVEGCTCSSSRARQKIAAVLALPVPVPEVEWGAGFDGEEIRRIQFGKSYSHPLEEWREMGYVIYTRTAPGPWKQVKEDASE